MRVIRVRRFALWVCLGVAAWALIGGEHGFVRYQMLKSNQRELTMETRRLTVAAMDLDREIWRLQHDTLYIEKVAREQLSFARPNERVYKITPH